MFQVNDTVLYGSHGVCRISEVTERKMGDQAVEYYVLQPNYEDGCTIFVPVGNTALTRRMRRILSEGEIFDLIQTMPDEESLWIEDESLRKERYKEILSSGDRQHLIQLIKAMYQHQEQQTSKGRRLHLSDERFFKDAEKMLYDEFAFVLHLDRDQVLPFILGQFPVEEGQPQ